MIAIWLLPNKVKEFAETNCEKSGDRGAVGMVPVVSMHCTLSTFCFSSLPFLHFVSLRFVFLHFASLWFSPSHRCCIWSKSSGPKLLRAARHLHLELKTGISVVAQTCKKTLCIAGDFLDQLLRKIPNVSAAWWERHCIVSWWLVIHPHICMRELLLSFLASYLSHCPLLRLWCEYCSLKACTCLLCCCKTLHRANTRMRNGIVQTGSIILEGSLLRLCGYYKCVSLFCCNIYWIHSS